MRENCPESPRDHIALRLSLFILALAGFTILSYETGIFHFFLDERRLLSFINSLGKWDFVGLILLQVLQVVVAPIPGEVTGLLGGYLYGPLWGTLISTVGLTIGSYAAFLLARYLGRPFVERYVPRPALDKFDYLLHHRATFLIFLLFLIPGTPKDYLCYILGLGYLSTLEFLVIGTIGRLFGTILLSLGGSFIKLHQYGRFSVLLALTLVCITLAIALRKRVETLFKRLHERSHKGRCTIDSYPSEPPHLS